MNRSQILAVSIATLLAAPVARAEVWTVTGGTSDWSTATWVESAGAGNEPGIAPPPVDGGIYTNIRLNINGTLTYSAADGMQTFDVSPVGGENRALCIGIVSDTASGTLHITGGTLKIVQEVAGTPPTAIPPVLIGSGFGAGNTGSGLLNVTGGLLDVSLGEIGLLTRGTGTASGIMTIGGTGAVVADIVSFGTLAAVTSATAVGAINLNAGGTLTTRVVFDRNAVANSSLNFDGGTLRSNDNNNAEDWVRAGVAVNILAGGAIFDTNGQLGQQNNVAMGGVGGVTKIGLGTMIYSQANTYAGTTTVNEGTLQIGNAGTTGTAGAGAVTVAPGATVAISRSNAVAQSALGGLASGLNGGGTLQKLGNNIFTADVANAHSGETLVSAGVLRITAAGALGDNVGTTTVAAGAALALAGTTVAGEAITINGDGGAVIGGDVAVASRGAIQGASGSSTWAGNVTIGGLGAVPSRFGIQEGASLTLSGTISDGGLGYTVAFRGANAPGGFVTIGGAGHSWGRTEIFGDTIRIAGHDMLPTGTTLAVGITSAVIPVSTFDLNGFNQQVAGLTQTSSATGVITNNGASDSVLILNGAIDETYLGKITDGATNKISLIKDGAFTQILNGANTYTGSTSINSGTLRTTTAQAGTGGLAVADGAIFALDVLSSGATFTTGPLTLGGAAGASVRIALGTAALSAVNPIFNATTFSASAGNAIELTGTAITTGIYPLIDYTGAIGGAGFGGLSITIPGAARALATLVDNAGATRVDLNVVNQSIKWTGATTADWDIDDSGTGTIEGTQNWVTDATATATNYLEGIGGTDSVILDNSATGSRVINLTSVLTPTKITVNKTTASGDYTLAGFGSISGATSLTKDNTGTLTIANDSPNFFTGVTTLNAGKIQVGDGVTFGAGSLGTGPVTINGGTLEANRPDGLTLTNAITGTAGTIAVVGGDLTLSNATTNFSGSVFIDTARNLIISQTTTLGGVLTGTGTLSAGAPALSIVTLSGNSPAFAGEIVAFSGSLQPTNSNAFGDATGETTVLSGASVVLPNGLIVAGETIHLNGNGSDFLGALQAGVGASAIWAGPMILASSGTRLGAQANGTLTATGGISDNGLGADLAISAAATGGTVIIGGLNTYGGRTNIIRGTLKLASADALPIGTTLDVHQAATTDAATFDLNGFNQTVAGLVRTNTTGAGTVTNSSGTAATFTVAPAVDNLFTGTITGNLSLVANAAATLTLTGNNTFTGTTHIAAGTLQLGNNAATGSAGAGAITSAAGATLAIARTDALTQSTFGGSYSGGGGFDLRGTGSFTMDVANSYSGATNVANNARLRVTHANALGDVAAGTTINGTGLDLDVDGNGGTLLLSGNITVTGESLTIRGTGGTPGGALVAQRGALQSQSDDNTWAGPVNIAGSFTRIGVQDGASLTISGPISDGGAGHVLTFRGGSTTAGMITLSGIGNTWGETRVYGSTVRIAGGDNILPTTAPLFIGTGGVGNSILDLNGRNQEVAGVSQIGNTTNFITNNGSTDSIVTLGGSVDRSWNGTFQDGTTNKLTLVKTGTFTQTLSGSSTHTGGTIIRGGVLNVTVNSALGAAGFPVTIENAATLQAGGALATAARTFTLGAGGGQIDTNGNTINLAPGSTVTGTALTKAGAGTLILGGTQTYATLTTAGGLTELDSPLGTGTSTLNADANTNISVSQTFAALVIGAGATVVLEPSASPAAIESLIDAGDSTFAPVEFVAGETTAVAAVPEPGSLLALLAGTGVLCGLRRRQRR